MYIHEKWNIRSMDRKEMKYMHFSEIQWNLQIKDTLGQLNSSIVM